MTEDASLEGDIHERVEPSDQIGHRGRRAFVRHVQEFRPGERLEQLAAEVR